MRPGLVRALALGCLLSTGCAGFVFSRPRPVANRLASPYRADARLAVTWIGHATVLLQMDDRFVLTDPLLGDSAGQLSVRLQEPGLNPDALPPLDLVVVSHLHFDHLSLGSLDRIEGKVRRLLVPQGGLVYVPNYAFEARELPTGASIEDRRGCGGVFVRVKHVGFRYGVDAAWMKTSFTGYVFEYHGLTVYFPGDTAYDRDAFRTTAATFPHIDLALIPIAPIHPRSFMEATHMDARGAPGLRRPRRRSHGADPLRHAGERIRRARGGARDPHPGRRRLRGVEPGDDPEIGGQAVIVAREPPPPWPPAPCNGAEREAPCGSRRMGNPGATGGVASLVISAHAPPPPRARGAGSRGGIGVSNFPEGETALANPWPPPPR